MPASPPDLVTRTLDVLDRLQPPSERLATTDATRLRQLVETACAEQGWTPDPAALEQALAAHWQACPSATTVAESPSSPSDQLASAHEGPVPFDFGWRRPTSIKAWEARRRWAWVTRFRLAANRRLQMLRCRSSMSTLLDLVLAWVTAGVCGTLGHLLGLSISGSLAVTLASFTLMLIFLGLSDVRPDLKLLQVIASPSDPWASIQPSEERVKRWFLAADSRAYLVACLSGPLPLLLERDAHRLDWLSRHATQSAVWSAQQKAIFRLMRTGIDHVDTPPAPEAKPITMGRTGHMWN